MCINKEENSVKYLCYVCAYVYICLYMCVHVFACVYMCVCVNPSLLSHVYLTAVHWSEAYKDKF